MPVKIEITGDTAIEAAKEIASFRACLKDTIGLAQTARAEAAPQAEEGKAEEAPAAKKGGKKAEAKKAPSADKAPETPAVESAEQVEAGNAFDQAFEESNAGQEEDAAGEEDLMDADDEAAEEQSETFTIDDVREAAKNYGVKYGMDVVTADKKKIFEGAGFKGDKFADIPEALLPKLVSDFRAAVEKNPFKRKVVG